MDREKKKGICLKSREKEEKEKKKKKYRRERKKKKEKKKKERMSSSNCCVLKITGMMCQKNCATTIENALKSLPGIEKVEVTFQTHSAKIIGHFKVNDLINCIEDIGFDACLIDNTPSQHTFKVLGMMCQKNCGTTVENALKLIPGVIWAKVDFPTQKAEVWDNNNIINENIFKEAIEEIGFDVLFETKGGSSNNLNITGKNENNLNNENEIEPDSVYWTEKKINVIIDLPIIRNHLLAIDGILSVEFDEKNHLIKVWGFADIIYVQKILKDCGFSTQVFNTINEAINMQKERKNRFHSIQQGTGSGTGTTGTIVDISSYKNNENAYVINLLVGGMSCANCAKSIETNLFKKK